MRTIITALALILATTAVAPADAVIGIRIPLGQAPATPAPTVVASANLQPSLSSEPTQCTAKATQIFAYASQGVNAFVTSNARNQGSLPGTWYASTRSAVGNMAQYAIVDFLIGKLTHHWSCASRSLIYFGLGASALNNASMTQFPVLVPAVKFSNVNGVLH